MIERDPDEQRSLARFLRARRAEIVSSWERAIRALPIAKALDRRRAVDHIPAILSLISELIERRPPPGDVKPRIEGGAADLHALARLDEGYDLGAVVTEYTMLRRCILEHWEHAPDAATRPDELRALDEAVDEVVVASIGRYTKARQRTLEALDRISSVALASGDLETFLPKLLEVVLETTEAVDTVAVLLLEGGYLRVRASVGLESEVVEKFQIAPGEGFAGTIAATGEPLLLKEGSRSPIIRSRHLRERDLKVIYGVPLVLDGAVIGVAHMGSRTAPEFSDEDKLVLRTMASRATALIVQQRSREALEASETRYRLALEATGLGTCDWDIAADAVRLSDRSAAIFGLESPAPLPFERFLDALHPEDREKARAAFAGALDPSGDGSCHLEARALGRDGAVRWFTAAGRATFQGAGDARRAVRMTAAVLDVTERTRAEEALRASEEHFRQIAESGMIAIAFFDLEGRVTDANDAILALVGYSREELRRQEVRWDRLTPRDWMPRTLEAVAELRRSGRCRPYEKEYVRKDGARIPILIGGAVDRRGNGVAFVLDITDRKRSEEALRGAVRARDEFVAVLSHDLRNPMTAIGLGAELLLRQLPEEQAALRKRADAIRAAAAHANRMIEGLLQEIAVEEGDVKLKLERHDPANLLTEVQETFLPSLEERRIVLATEVAPSLPWVRCDRDSFSRAMGNLVSNASRFTPPGGTITLRAAPAEHAVRFSVTDTGPGVAPEHRARLFQRGFRASNGDAGLGLGLAIVKGIVEGHGGTIGVESEPGKGATFWFTVPAAVEARS